MPATTRVGEGGIQIFLPPLWRGHSKLLYAFGLTFDEELTRMQAMLCPGATVIDIGANMGLWTTILARTVGPTGHVLAIEPTRATFETLKKNVHLNGLDNVQLLRLAASDSPGTLRLYHHADPTRNSLGRGPSAAEATYEDVSTETLDQVIQKAQLKAVDFLKIDVEGAEELVLKGAAELLRTHKPLIYFEINASAIAALSLQQDGAWNLLKSYGYQFFCLEPGGKLAKIGEPAAMVNVLALHPSNVAQQEILQGRPLSLGARQQINSAASAR